MKGFRALAATAALVVAAFTAQSDSVLHQSSFGVLKEHFGWTEDGVLTRGTVSLRDFPWTAEHPWIRDFEYDSLFNKKFGVISYVPRYTPQMVAGHVAALRDLPWVTPSKHADERMVLGMTPGWPEGKELPNWPYAIYGDPAVPPQDVYGFTITDLDSDAEKLNVVLVAGNHSTEMHGSWVLHGMVDFLVSEDPRAEALRRVAAFHVYPLACPESRYLESRRPTMPPLTAQDLPEDQYRAQREVERNGVERIVEAYPLRGSPELYAHDDTLAYWEDRGALRGRPDHNRVWNTEGEFATIGLITAAMKADTGGKADYVWDFHGGYPHDPGDYRGGEQSMTSAYAQALEARGWPYPEVQRRVTGPAAPGQLRMWAKTEDGLNAAHSLLFEPGQQLDKRQTLLSGKRLAVAFHDAYVE